MEVMSSKSMSAKVCLWVQESRRHYLEGAAEGTGAEKLGSPSPRMFMELSSGSISQWSSSMAET